MTYLQKKFGLPALVSDASAHQAFGADLATNQSLVPAHVEVGAQHYDNLDVEIDPEARTYWCSMLPQGRGSFTPGLLQDLIGMQKSIERMFAERTHEAKPPFDYFVLASRCPGIFNRGGDLGLFAEKIRLGERDALRSYAHSCIEAVYNGYVSFNSPVVTIALVQGEALGGGFESALALDLIVAEKSARMGFPEILFNLFPGMGAYSLLSRRLGAAQAEKMILSGKIYTAEELHEIGIVDVLAEDGEGELATREYIDRHAYRHNAYRAVFQTRKRVNPVTFNELRDVTDIWVEAAMGLSESDLRRMGRLTAAQDRRQTSRNMAMVASVSAE
ncbi:MAG: enoyl-CoA hydratase [Rhodospirillales bacterium]|nr:enoyl-CoA hydratase [Rhodospirillales bacterium]